MINSMPRRQGMDDTDDMDTIPRWTPSSTVSEQEEHLLSRLTRVRKLFGFLRLHRAKLFDESFQDELATMYRQTGAGKDPCPPALLAMAVLLQGYLQISDAEAVELTVMDKRWQLVLDRLDEKEPAFSQGALFAFRGRLIRTGMDRRLLVRTAELAKETKDFDYKKLPKTLRLAVDSAPLAGAGRVEDTINLLWHAARKIVEGVAQWLEWEQGAVCKAAGIPLLLGSSAKAALDVDWSEPEQKQQALEQLVDQLESLVAWLTVHHTETMKLPPVAYYVDAVQQVVQQDLEPQEAPEADGLQIREGVAPDRRISIEDEEMRHGRKSKSQLIDGYKRHIGTDLDSDLILACAVTPANRPEAEATPAIEEELAAQGLVVDELFIDQGYAGSSLAQSTLDRGGKVHCRPRVSNNGEFFRKEDFTLDLEAMTITCPAGQQQLIQLGKTVKFDVQGCQGCADRPRCTDAAPDKGRSVSIAKDERLQQQRRQRVRTAEGRAVLRQRVKAEHRLAHVVARQGDRARYLGVRKNLFDVRRASAIQNLETIQRRVRQVTGVPY
jgi:Transposase DDE domain/Transposase domain (DUF772)